MLLVVRVVRVDVGVFHDDAGERGCSQCDEGYPADDFPSDRVEGEDENHGDDDGENDEREFGEIRVTHDRSFANDGVFGVMNASGVARVTDK